MSEKTSRAYEASTVNISILLGRQQGTFKQNKQVSETESEWTACTAVVSLNVSWNIILINRKGKNA
jgi:hypothetical protein